MSTRGPYAKGLIKRDEILDAALELFAQRGYDRTSVREVARQAGLSQAGLLHHFSTKEELFLEVLRRRDDRSTDEAEPVHTHSVDRLIGAVDRNAGEPGLVRLFVAMSAESAADASEARAFFAERYEWLLDQIAADVRAHQASGDIDPDVDAEDAASLLVAAADGLQIQWLLNPDGVDMPGRIRSLWNALKNAR
ncbi:TetR/AcrR family transcriptional regulator [Mycetocola zhujimingii]|uniref:TetR family transcriptional regulator n=1 Tax=Mycetocola zhujimingii TaxID=2079792 RepID=A0A2U1TCD6_9MICO|nr:TetR/AcrR family transcriptional regulator [Mycetocola zhujimingii]PWC06470.1 TetR family transcriptional regulator [Mycetocola zhujimingii]